MMASDISGKLIYTDRAFRQDASEAMKGNIVTGLIELITNADDAYKDVGISGNIVIEISQVDEPFKYKVVVRDEAKGLPFELLKKSFVELGAENRSYLADKGAEQGSRGLFGRGAKDVAIFGKAIFETICDDKYSALEIDPFQGSYTIIAESLPANEQLRKQLNLPGNKNGLSASVLILKSKANSLPSLPRLVEQLSNHVSLRGIVQRHSVTLADKRTNKTTVLKHKVPEFTELIDNEFEIPGYNQKVHLIFRRYKERQVGNLDEYSYHGLVIRDKRANYENTFLSLSQRPESGWFGGELIAPEIDILNRQIDEIDRNPAETPESIVKANPMRLVKRSREGLERSHPYYRALDKLIQANLKSYFDEVASEEDANKSESQDLRKRLDLASKSLAEILKEALEEAEAGDLPEGGIGVDFTKIGVIPPRKSIEINKSGTLTLRAPQFAFDAQKARVELIDSNGAFTISDLNPEKLNWKAHERLSVMQATVRVTAKDFGSTELLFHYGEETASSTLICERIKDVEIPDPDDLEFEESVYSLAPTRSRSIVLYAPSELVGETVEIESDTKLVTFPPKVQLRFDSTGSYCFAKVKLTALRETGSTSIIAKVGSHRAQTELNIKDSDLNKGPKIDIGFKNQDAPNRSALILLGDVLRIEIYAKHKAIKSVLGSHNGDKYEHIDTPAWHATLVEIVSTQLSNYAIEREYSVHPHKFRDATSLFIKQQSLMTRFITTMQVFLLSESNNK